MVWSRRLKSPRACRSPHVTEHLLAVRTALWLFEVGRSRPRHSTSEGEEAILVPGGPEVGAGQTLDWNGRRPNRRRRHFWILVLGWDMVPQDKVHRRSKGG